MSGLVPEHVKGDVENMFGSSYDLQCLPLYTMMLAMGNPTINLFILDIEGAEFQVNILKLSVRLQKFAFSK